jgi:CDP-glucose 4,6-dehydratase
MTQSMNVDFWKGKRVFLTGHTGFKGSWMSLWLQEMGAIVKGYSLVPPTEPSLFVEANVDSGMESQVADIRDYQTLFNSIDAFKPEIVFHMAAQPLVRLSYDIPIDTYSTNVMGTVHLLEACRKVSGIKAIVNITSDKCYENQEWVWGYRENEPMGGYDPYSNSKGCAELVASSFRQSFFNPAAYAEHGVGLASVRAGNVIGGGDWALDRLIPDILLAFQEGRAVEIRSPHAIRPWQHVLEPISGYLATAEKLYTEGAEYSEAWNFGPNDEDAQPVQRIVETLSSNWGDEANWFLSEGDHPHEAHYLKLDCSKAKMRLNWQPVWDLNTTLSKITQWHKAWLTKTNMREYTLTEIKEYMNARIGLN